MQSEDIKVKEQERISRLYEKLMKSDYESAYDK